MALTVTHAYQSTVKEGSTSGTPGGAAGPNEWNAPHVVTGSVPEGPTTITTQGGMTYTYQPSDAQGWVRFTNPSGCTVTIPPSTFTIGTQLVGEAATPGAVKFIAGAGVTFGPSSPINAQAQNSVVSFMQVASNLWIAFGSIS